MTREQKNLLEPLARIYWSIEQAADAMDDAQLIELEKACAAASMTNCWSCTFRVSGILLPIIRGRRLHLKRRAQAATPPPSPERT